MPLVFQANIRSGTAPNCIFDIYPHMQNTCKHVHGMSQAQGFATITVLAKHTRMFVLHAYFHDEWYPNMLACYIHDHGAKLLCTLSVHLLFCLQHRLLSVHFLSKAYMIILGARSYPDK
jgi:hypothetical protein